MSRTIDITPTWAEWARVYQRLAESGETNAIRHLGPDLLRMGASAEALKAVLDTLDEAQHEIVARTISTELAKFNT